MPTTEEIAWAAGLFEGEGSIVAVKKTAVALSIESTDLDVIEHFQRVVGAGSITSKTGRKTTNQRPSWMLQIYGVENTRRILTWFLPWFHSRRRAKAEEMLARLEGNLGPRERRTHCIHGHEFTEANVYHDPNKPHQRKCRQCHRERALRYYHERDRSPEKEAKRRALNAERQRRYVARKRSLSA